jgi:hypothetical protein
VDVGIAGMPGQSRQAGLFQAHIVVVAEVVEAHDTMSVGQQALGEVVADEAGGSGD